MTYFLVISFVVPITTSIFFVTVSQLSVKFHLYVSVAQSGQRCCLLLASGNWFTVNVAPFLVFSPPTGCCYGHVNDIFLGPSHSLSV